MFSNILCCLTDMKKFDCSTAQIVSYNQYIKRRLWLMLS